MSFFNELKRRNVIKVAIAYIVSSWLVLQVGELAADSFGAPEWVMKMFFTLLALGFPFAIILAWAFEMTPEGIKKEKNVDRAQSITNVTGAKLNRNITIALIVALGYFAVDKFVLDPKRDAELVQTTQSLAEQSNVITGETISESSDKSIAVLPFVNMSDDGANEYFSDGLSEELLNLLAKIPELKVAARTSSFQFKGQTGDIEDIAAQLKVAHILEGSVRKSGNQVRITAQLIKADDGYHLWSETYDRTLENIFVVQDEIASAVVSALKLTLLGETAPKTREANPEAYALFLQGRYWYNLVSKENYVKSVDAYQRAIAIDPDYAPAWAGLAMSTLHQAGQSWIDFESGVEQARDAAEHAISLDPDLALGWISLSQIQADYDWNWSAANKSIEKALKLEPNSNYVLSAAGRLSGSMGQPEQSISYRRQAHALDPLNQRTLSALASALEKSGRFEEAKATLGQLYTLNPNFAGVHIDLGWILLQQGKAEQALAESEKASDPFWRELLRQLTLVSLGRLEEADAELPMFVENFQSFGAYQIAETYAWRNDPDMAFKWLDQAYSQHDPGMGSLLKDNSLKGLHKDHRWETLLEKVGLLDAWNEMPAKYRGPLQ